MTTAADLQLEQFQFDHLLGIVAGVGSRNLPIKAAYIAVETAIAESGLSVYASANVPASVNLPHQPVSFTADGLGHDHASVGMFQQQVGENHGALPGTSTADWGPVEDLMDPAISTGLFLDAMVSMVPNWASLDNWVVAQRVQRSAYDGAPRKANNFRSEFGGNYHDQDGRARQLVDAVWGEGGHGASSRQLGGFMADLTEQEQREMLGILRDLHANGVAPGQTSTGGTVRATLRSTQTLVNMVNGLSGAVAKLAGEVEAIRKKVGA
jgi:hypothetical protein